MRIDLIMKYFYNVVQKGLRFENIVGCLWK